MTVFTVAKKYGSEKRQKKNITGPNYGKIREALAYVCRGEVLPLIRLQRTLTFHI
jgi:hypothetical protein